MKLDKIKFAYVVKFIMALNPENWVDIEKLDELIDIEMPKLQPQPQADAGMIAELMEAIFAGEKIRAIKAHRSLTGYGLEKSKDAVELNWNSNWLADLNTLKQVKDALGTAETGSALVEVARNAHKAEMELAVIKRNLPEAATLGDILNKATNKY